MALAKDLKIVMEKIMVDRTVEHMSNKIRKLASTSIFVQNIGRFNINWGLVWAAMDTVEDTELATNSYRHDNSGSDHGREYLKVYGPFQAMFMQQDAIRNFTDGFQLLEVSIAEYQNASGVRGMRNKYFGHHKYRRNGVTTYHGVSRFTAGTEVITAWTHPHFSIEEINLEEAIRMNRDYITDVLERIFNSMKEKKTNYTQSFKGKLSEDRQPYAFEKLYSWVYDSTSDCLYNYITNPIHRLGQVDELIIAILPVTNKKQ